MHAVVDLVNGFRHSYNGGRPEDFSAVWALLAAGVMAFIGFVYLISLNRVRLWSFFARIARLPMWRTAPRRPR
jgi:uncharacterized membrane protein YgdD (TMEM256/DUF423 family)